MPNGPTTTARPPGFTPTRPPPAPREARRRFGANFGIWAIRLFILPHMLAGAFFLFAMLAMPAWVLSGQNTTTPVTRVWSDVSKGKTYYRLAYIDPATGKPSGQSTIDRAEYERLSKLLATSRPVEADPNAPSPPMVTVHTLGTGTFSHSEVLMPGESGWKTVGLIWLFGLFWNGILSFFVFAVWVGPHQERNLYRDGEATLGRLTAKSTARRSKGGTTYLLTYAFTPSRGGMMPKSSAEASGKQTVEKNEWERASEGEAVWVLHWPGKDKPSLLYGHGSFRHA
jgi:hypothetical protein